MYRAYENPHTLEQQLEELRQEFCDRVDAGEDLDELVDLECDIHDLEERINFAWQDDEYDDEPW